MTTSNDDIPKKAYKISSIKCRDMLYKIVHGMTLDLWKVVPIFACTICCHKLYNYPCTSSVNVCIINEIIFFIFQIINLIHFLFSGKQGI